MRTVYLLFPQARILEKVYLMNDNKRSDSRLVLCYPHNQVGIDIGFHVQSFLSEADMGVRMTGGNVAVMGDMVRGETQRRVCDLHVHKQSFVHRTQSSYIRTQCSTRPACKPFTWGPRCEYSELETRPKRCTSGRKGTPRPQDR